MPYWHVFETESAISQANTQTSYVAEDDFIGYFGDVFFWACCSEGLRVFPKKFPVVKEKKNLKFNIIVLLMVGGQHPLWSMYEELVPFLEVFYFISSEFS